jgi:hypothetical protein
MDEKTIHELTENVINAIARVERAKLALTIAEEDLRVARFNLEKGLIEYRKKNTPNFTKIQDFTTLNAEERALVESGNYIQAIKDLRERAGFRPNGDRVLNVKDAKEIVDAYRSKLGLL